MVWVLPSTSRSRSTRRPRPKAPQRSWAKVRAEAETVALVCETVHVNSFPAEGILATAKGKDCDLIVMASHGRRGVARLLLGSQAVEVLTLSSVPVLICR